MRYLMCVTLFVIGCVSHGKTTISEKPGVRDVSFFLKRLRTVDHLPELEESHTAMSSTWDRSGGNLDGWDWKRVEGNKNILLDIDGPGCIHRIFTGMLGDFRDMFGKPGVRGTKVQVFLDHNPIPIFDMLVDDFFDDRNGPFTYPLVFHKTYPGILFPIPFAKHCLFQLVNDKEPNWGNYWQITYTIYKSSTKIKSLEWPLEDHEKQQVLQVRDAWLDAESRPPVKPAKWAVERQLSIQPAKSDEIKLDGCGIIRQIRFSGGWFATPEVLRETRLTITWDGSQEPSVDVPIGYLFGNADYAFLNDIHFNSLLLGLIPTEAYCTFPMPFSGGAVLKFENKSK
jgi:hypothetical protein